MKLDADTIKDYPRFHYYVRVNMPEVAKVDSIINAIKKISGKTSMTTIREAMKYGNNPLIKVVENLTCAGDPALGCYRFGSDELRVNKRLVDEFEAGRGVVKTKGGKKVYLVGVTILHELTHWADAQDGENAAGEDGDAYEVAIYGDVLDESDLIWLARTSAEPAAGDGTRAAGGPASTTTSSAPIIWRHRCALATFRSELP